MKREQLKDLGLTDEQIGSVMALHGQSMTDTNTKIATAEQEVKTLKSQIDERDKDLAKVKKEFADNETIKVKFEELQSSYKDLKEKSEQQVTTIKRESALAKLLSDAKVKNPKAVSALLDNDLIKFENDTLTGVTEQLEALKKSDAYLFDMGQQQGGYQPGNGSSRTIPEDLVSAMKDPEFNMTNYLKNKGEK